MRFCSKQMPKYYHHKANSRNRNHLDICCSVHTEGANFNNPEGYTSLRVIASPSLNQDQLWRLFDLVPGLDFLHLDTKSRLVCIALTAQYTFVSFSIELCLRLHTRWKNFEYNRIVWFMGLVRQSLFFETQVCDYSKWNAKWALLCCNTELSYLCCIASQCSVLLTSMSVMSELNLSFRIRISFWMISFCVVYYCRFGGLGVACWPLVPKFAGSNPAETVGFLRTKKSSVRFPSEGK